MRVVIPYVPMAISTGWLVKRSRARVCECVVLFMALFIQFVMEFSMNVRFASIQSRVFLSPLFLAFVLFSAFLASEKFSG